MSASEGPFELHYAVDRDIPNTFASRVTDSLWFGPIIFLRSASPL
jgi:hypothetical protein